jgi:hypothetical protein
MKRLIYLMRELEMLHFMLAVEIDSIMKWDIDLLSEKKQRIRLWLDRYKDYNIVLPRPLMIEITLALLED